MQRIAPTHHRTRNHEAAQRWVRDLVFDLKLQMLGEQPRQPITIERLDEWDKLRDLDQDLDKCTRPALYY